MNYLGIDSGAKGYMCWCSADDQDVRIAMLPRRKGRLAQRAIHLVKEVKRKDYDYEKLLRFVGDAVALSGGRLVAAMEEPQMFMGGGKKANGKQHGSRASSICDLHRACGLISAACASHNVPLYLLAAISWKSRLKLVGTPKEYTLEYANRLRPDLEFPAVDAADAYLIATVARKMRLGQ